MHEGTCRKWRSSLIASAFIAGLLGVTAQNAGAQQQPAASKPAPVTVADASPLPLPAPGAPEPDPTPAPDPQAPAPGAQAPAPAAPPATPPVDLDTPFAFADFTWMLSNPRNHDEVLDGKYFSGEFRVDTNFMYDYNHPVDHTLDETTEGERTGEFVIQALGVGGDFHAGNMQGRILTQFGAVATAVPRNDASYSVGQWQLNDAYRYLTEMWGGYHINYKHGLNIQVGDFLSYIGLFSYYSFDNWTLPAVLCVVQYAMVLHRNAGAIFPHQQTEDRALAHKRLADLCEIQRPIGVGRADSVAAHRKLGFCVEHLYARTRCFG